MREIQPRRWTREEYYRMAKTGVLRPDERVELIDGEVFQVVPQRSLHATAILMAEKALKIAFGEVYNVRYQLPLALDPHSEPEPDVSVVRGSYLDYRDEHPSTAVLVVEVLDTTLKTDRNRKGSLYARARIPEYWIVNLLDQRLEVYRDPVASATARYGWEYKTFHHYSAGQSISPSQAPQAQIAVADLLP